jgi:hypothetical protein
MMSGVGRGRSAVGDGDRETSVRATFRRAVVTSPGHPRRLFLFKVVFRRHAVQKLLVAAGLTVAGFFGRSQWVVARSLFTRKQLRHRHPPRAVRQHLFLLAQLAPQGGDDAVEALDLGHAVGLGLEFGRAKGWNGLARG